MDGETDPQPSHPSGTNILRTRGPNSSNSNPVFDDGMMIENGDIIYGILDKVTAGAKLGGLVNVTFREKGPEVARQLFSSLFSTTDSA